MDDIFVLEFAIFRQRHPLATKNTLDWNAIYNFSIGKEVKKHKCPNNKRLRVEKSRAAVCIVATLCSIIILFREQENLLFE